LPISAAETISLAFQHTKRQLVQPFRFWQWTKLALVGLLAGETGSSSGVHFPSNFNFPQHDGSSRHLVASGFPHIDPVVLTTLISILVIAGLFFFVLLTYISSVMRFILFDSILARECHIREGWQRRQGPGFGLFLWQLGFFAITMLAGGILIGIPLLLAFTMGWFKAPHEHMAGLILGGILMFFVVVIYFVALILIHVLTKDFVVPQMALENIGAIEGWRRLLQMMDGEKGGYAAYLGMKIVLAIAAGIVIAIATLIVVLAVVFPAAALGVIAVIGAKAAGLTWNVGTITVAVLVGCFLFALVLYLIALISVPAIVFFPAYSIYFFAPRYRPLSLALYPPPSGPAPSPPLAPALYVVPALRVLCLRPRMRPRESPPHNAFHEQMIGRVRHPDTYSKVELPLRTEIDVDRRNDLLLLIAQRIKPRQ